jgi:predicted RNA-binding Zn-ribbon protein involved in translation (DUF1610 family)
MNGISGGALAVGFVGVAAVLILVVVAAVFAVGAMLASTERLVASAEPRLAALACPRCGVAIGSDGAAAACAAHEEAVRKLRETAGAAILRLRIDPYWRFACPACGAALKFDPGEGVSPLTEV